jgi:hypothetical protein
MQQEEIERIARKITEVKRLLEEFGQTRFEGVNANIKRAMISIQQALYDLGKEEQKDV